MRNIVASIKFHLFVTRRFKDILRTRFQTSIFAPASGSHELVHSQSNTVSTYEARGDVRPKAIESLWNDRNKKSSGRSCDQLKKVSSQDDELLRQIHRHWTPCSQYYAEDTYIKLLINTFNTIKGYYYDATSNTSARQSFRDRPCLVSRLALRVIDKELTCRLLLKGESMFPSYPSNQSRTVRNRISGCSLERVSAKGSIS